MSLEMKKLAPMVVVDGVRTPFVKSGAGFAGIPAEELGRLVAREVMTRTAMDPKGIDEVLFGCVGQSAKAANIARVIALKAGVDESVPALTVHRNCASGMEAVTQTLLRAHAGFGSAFLVGGTESMSDYPLVYSKSMRRWFDDWQKVDSLFGAARAWFALRPGMLKPEVALLQGLTDPVHGLNMGQTAELLAQDFCISRTMQDEYALRSHKLATAARQRLRDETIDVITADGTLVRDDGSVRDGQSMAMLGQLKTIFDRHSGSVTAGNACPVSDGACAMLLMTESAASDLGYEPLGRIVDFVYTGLDPTRMGLGPAYAIGKLLRRSGLAVDDIDLFEVNEAFAAQVLAVLAAMSSGPWCSEHLGLAEPLGAISDECLNVNGGAIALGHPVGASGARLILTLMRELRRRGMKRGVASLCVGGGQGGAVLVEV